MSRKQTIEELWQGYAAAVEVPMGGVQWTETRRSFYAGAFAILSELRRSMPGDEDEGVRWLQSLEEEARQFAKRVERGKA